MLLKILPFLSDNLQLKLELIDLHILKRIENVISRLPKGFETEIDCDEDDVCKCNGCLHQPHPEVLRATSCSLETKRTLL